MTDITEEQQEIVAKVEKLLRLAAKNPNEAEAASATNKAMELLAAYNLDLAAVERNSGDTGKRAQEDLEGGKFEWERDLWKAVASLNWCIYWNESKVVPTPLSRTKHYVRGKGLVPAIVIHQHKIVGRTVNIAATKAMATYLQDVVERLTKERCVPAKISLRSKFAMSFREGLTFGIQEKVWDRRSHLMSEEKRKAHEAASAAVHAATAGATAGASASTAITLTSFAQTEHDENVDFMYGAGTSAKWAADRARKAAAKKAADEEYTAWAAAHPKEARREEAKRKKEAEQQERRDARANRFKGDEGAWLAGHAKSKDVSLDLQAEGRKKAAGLLR